MLKKANMDIKKIYLYPVWVRTWHIINALSFLLLAVTGISMHYAGEGSVFMKFELSVLIHNICAIILSFNFLIYVIGNMITGNGKFYRNWRKNLSVNLWKQFRFYAFGIFKKEPHPFPIDKNQKFNPLQKLSYVMAMYFGMPLIIISGLGLMFPELVAYNIFKISGLLFIDLVHIIVGFALTIFLIIHLYTCTLGSKPGTLFKSMVNGYHEEHEEDPEIHEIH